MRRTLVFLWLFTKRLFKKPSFVLILLIMPLLVLGLKLVLKEDSDSLHVAILVEDDSEQIEAAIDDLLDDSGAFTFYTVDDLKELKEDVLTNYADCGFVLTKDLYKGLLYEQAENRITLYESTKTMFSDMAKEELYATIYKYYYFDYMKKTLDDKGYYEMEGSPSKEEAAKFLEEHYNLYVNDGGIFNVVYNGGESEVNAEDMKEDKSWMLKSMKGVLGVFVMIAAFAGAIFRAIDEKNGVYKTLGYAEKPYVNLVMVFLPTFIAGIVAYVSLIIAGVFNDYGAEAGKLILYVFMLTGAIGLLRSIVDSELALCSILPMITVVCVVGMNIFVNIASYVPAIRQLRYLMLPNYYLNYMNTERGMKLSVSILVVSTILAIIVDKRRAR